ncbi:Cytidylate kinase [Paraliobacillus sp. PM-2]|uniref:(d)CMP kinase n=1 Tax=Paraliobacillus sp. PM-2 TaxID=1462524 RepID=UPI00061B9385|nr:(d)CMP kinase [Paraliobacillus sp. PM-2]CQR46707.1 Cytidylate kinase [Paraliobacillus sp. PM-2]
MRNNKIAIAIDGPAAAGKSTVAKKVAHQLDYIYIDTGAMYRALTYKALQTNTPLTNGDALFHLAKESSIDLKQTADGQKVFVGHEDVTDAIRGENVTNHVSIVAQHRLVREEMVKQQQELAAERGVVMDGRDIGTHVIPDAEVKIFLIASVEERAIRRHEENTSKGFASDLEKLKDEIAKRDKLDSEREISPLIKAKDAIEIDTTALSINEVTQKILKIVCDKKERKL